MLKNFIVVAWRNIIRRKFQSFITVFGLAIGILFTFLITDYVLTELNVNKQLRNADRQYILRSIWKDPNFGADITTLGPLSKRLNEDYPNLVSNYYRWDGITSVVSKGDKHLRANIQLGDSTLLSMYGFELMHGDKNSALNEPFSAVVTPRAAIKYFGRTDIVGETVTIQSFSGGKQDFKITGVIEELPQNTVTNINAQNHNDFFIPTNTRSFFGRQDFESWFNTILPSYIELKEGVKPEDLTAPIRQLIQQNAPEGVRENLTVVPVSLHDFYMNQENGIAKRMLYTLGFVGVFILLMAIINFVNISISAAVTRTKEVGMRKVLGSMRSHIIKQFLVEAVIIVLISTILALLLFPIGRDLFTALVGKSIPRLVEFPVYYAGFVFLFVILIGVLAGIYPAIMLSSKKSIESLKGKSSIGKENVFLRRSLVGMQFCIAAVVMIAAYIITQQISHFFGQSLGYNKEFIVSSQVPRDWTPAGVRKMETIKQEFARMPQVSGVALSFEIPNGMNGAQPPVYKSGTDSTTAVAMQSLVTDESYLSVYQIPLAAGTFFRPNETDSSRVVLNEKAVEALGYKNAEDAVAKQLRIPISPITYTVVGVTKDFHFGSMQGKIEPFIYFQPRLVNSYRFLSFKLKPGNITQTIEEISNKWATLLPGSSFEYTFMDDTLAKLYDKEIQMKKAAYTATFVALCIVFLGVLGLLSFSIQKRTKEIGIRKVLGASLQDIVSLFLKEFIPVLIIGGIISVPLAWIIMKDWLNNYAYRIELTPQPFMISLIALAIFTTLLIGIRIAFASRENPVKSLRSE